ncbi:MAG: PrsW family intramembrane metalloprotease [Planctomycetaceae bacterium]|nr:PrsW family intramembrane metalloprotease [Planctomycetaceae bacterium]
MSPNRDNRSNTGPKRSTASDSKEDSTPQRNPYEVPLSPTALPTPTSNARNHSISAEPWMTQQVFFSPEDPHANLDHPATLARQAGAVPESELAEHSVWDEHATSEQLRDGLNPDAVTWFRFYQKQVVRRHVLTPWLVTCLIIFLAGPLAILGALFNEYGGSGFVVLLIFGPTVEEVLKIAWPLWVVEKRPWLFSNGLQLLLCGIGGGLAFALIENLIYLNIYIPDASPQLIA